MTIKKQAKKIILVVEDEAVVAQDIKMTLEKLGYGVINSITTGDDAIKTAEADRPDLVLMDIKLKGGMNGIEAAKKINKLDIPVVFLTAYGDKKTVEAAKEAEPRGFAHKPFEAQRLCSTIEIAMYRHDTDRKLRQNEKHYRAIVEAAFDGFWVCDKQGKIIDVNESCCRMIGYSREELLNMSISDVETIEKPKETAEHLKRIIKYGYDRFETRHKRKDGKILDMEISAVYSGDDGGQFLVFLRNVTESRKKEKKIKFLLSMIEQSSEGMAIADLNGYLLFVNRAWAEMHGYKSGEKLVGRHLKIFHNEEQLKKDVAPFNRKVMEKGSNTGEVGHIRRDGVSFPTLMTTNILKDKAGKPMAIAGIAKDITRRRRVEKKLRLEKDQIGKKNEELKRFNRLSVGREMRMIELKEKISELKKRLSSCELAKKKP